ncbi:paralemmin-3 [Dendropsophus ebraccatus]|uniref:paralemmin-3 n=1 Tax=Dendropsophus ebraccatus TaxID=150705 RepID=UPI003831B187
MGETQIYSQRLHGITEKRRITDEVDRIKGDLEMQKLKLQQLKRKSLRDRWLMDGLGSPGAEIENPLNETEEKIKRLEHELESLQLQLLYLENPELKIEHLKKLQGSDSHRQLVNGDPGQQISDQKDMIPKKRENQKEHKVIQEEDIQPNGEDEKQAEVTDPSQKNPAPSKEVMVGHPIPAPRGKKVEKIQDQKSPDHKLDGVDQRNEEELDEKIHDKEIKNLNHEPQDDRSENPSLSEELKDENHDQDHGHTDQDLSNQNSECLDKRLEVEEENMGNISKGLEHIDLSFDVEGPKLGVSQLSQSNEDIRNDLDNQYNVIKVTLIEESDQHESDMQPALVVERYEDQGELLVRVNNSQDLEARQRPVLVSVIQDHNEEIIPPSGNQGQHGDSAIPRCQEEPLDPVPVLISHNNDQDMKSTLFPEHQSLELLSSDQEQSPKLPCKDLDANTSLPCEALASQVQISQVVIISTPAHASSKEPTQDSSGSQQSPSTNRRNQPATTEAGAPAESQPLLHKPAETDAQSGPHGTNTAETRDKNPTGKKKSCHCCVVM